MTLDMLGVPRVGDSLDIYEFLPVNERHKYRHAKVVDCWWEPDRNRTLCPRLIVEYGPLPQKEKESETSLIPRPKTGITPKRPIPEPQK